MFSKVISKIRCYSPNSANTTIRNYNNLYYIATRAGVDIGPFKGDRGDSDNATYAKYIHERPRSHGLFGNIETDDINRVGQNLKEISKTQCIYRGILSLSEDDAQALGFRDKTAWKEYLTLALPQISEALGIPAAEMQWVAALHREKGHPHVHYMLWCNNPDHVQTPFISIPQQHKCREYFSGRFFAAERAALYKPKTKARDDLVNAGKEDTRSAIQQLVDDITSQPSYQTLHRINWDFLDASSAELLNIAKNLPKNGSLKYKYLPPDLKKQVNQLVQSLLGKEELKIEYDNFLNYHMKIAETYSPTKKELQVAIAKGKEDIDQRLANVVLKAAHDLRKDKDLYYALMMTRLPSYQSLLVSGISEKTISALKEEGKRGDAKADYLLGRIFDDPQSDYYAPKEALQYYKSAADKGDSNAQGIIGNKYIWGKDLEHNESDGRKYLHMAQEQRNEYAKTAEQAYDTYQKEHANYRTFSLMSDLLSNLCYANHTRSSSSVYHSNGTDNKKALKERARKHLSKHSEHIER